MNEIPPPRDTIPPEAGEDFKHRSTLPPFASEQRVSELEDKHAEVMATLGEILQRLDTLTNHVAAFHADVRALEQRVNKLAGRVAALDGKREASNGHGPGG